MGANQVSRPGDWSESVSDRASPRGWRLLASRRRRLVAIACTVIVFLALISTPLLTERQVVKVGVLVPLTGSASYLVDVVDGISLAAEKLNRWGGMNGADIELLIRDTESDAARAVAVFEELEREEKPLFYVSAQSHLTLPLVPLAEENQVVLIGVVTSVPSLTEYGDWTVRYYSTSEDEADATLHSISVLGVTDIGLLHASDEYSVSVMDILCESADAAGLSMYCHEITPADGYGDDVSLVMGREAVVVSATGTHMGGLVTALRDMGYDGEIVTTSAGSSPKVLSLPEAEGIYVSAPAMYNENYLPAKSLSAEYEERYGKPLTQYASCGYDVLYLVSGLIRDMDLTRANVHASLEAGFTFSGTTGPLQVDPGVHDIGFELYSAKVSEEMLWYL